MMTRRRVRYIGPPPPLPLPRAQSEQRCAAAAVLLDACHEAYAEQVLVASGLARLTVAEAEMLLWMSERRRSTAAWRRVCREFGGSPVSPRRTAKALARHGLITVCRGDAALPSRGGNQREQTRKRYAVCLRLTQRGRSLAARLRDTESRFFDTLARRLSSGEREAVSEGMRLLRNPSLPSL